VRLRIFLFAFKIPNSKVPAADVNMIFMLLMDFLAPSSDEEEVVLFDQIAQLALDPMMAVFENPLMMRDNISKLCLLRAELTGSQCPKYSLMGELQLILCPM